MYPWSNKFGGLSNPPVVIGVKGSSSQTSNIPVVKDGRNYSSPPTSVGRQQNAREAAQKIAATQLGNPGNSSIRNQNPTAGTRVPAGRGK